MHGRKSRGVRSVSPMQSNMTLPSLSPELISSVCRFLDAWSITRLGTTCHSVHQDTSDNVLWRQLCVERLPPPTPSSKWLAAKTCPRTCLLACSLPENWSRHRSLVSDQFPDDTDDGFLCDVCDCDVSFETGRFTSTKNGGELDLCGKCFCESASFSAVKWLELGFPEHRSSHPMIRCRHYPDDGQLYVASQTHDAMSGGRLVICLDVFDTSPSGSHRLLSAIASVTSDELSTPGPGSIWGDVRHLTFREVVDQGLSSRLADNNDTSSLGVRFSVFDSRGQCTKLPIRWLSVWESSLSVNVLGFGHVNINCNASESEFSSDDDGDDDEDSPTVVCRVRCSASVWCCADPFRLLANPKWRSSVVCDENDDHDDGESCDCDDDADEDEDEEHVCDLAEFLALD